MSAFSSWVASFQQPRIIQPIVEGATVYPVEHGHLVDALLRSLATTLFLGQAPDSQVSSDPGPTGHARSDALGVTFNVNITSRKRWRLIRIRRIRLRRLP